MEKNNRILLYCFLGLTFVFCFLWGLGSYPLLEVDETRYVDMASKMFHSKDYLTLYLNGEYFFEKPPFFFWLECASFGLTGVVSEFTARLPIVLLSILPAGLLFGLCKKVKGEKFAIIATATLFTSLEYMFLTKVAILDSVLTSFIAASVLCYFYTFFTQEKNKKYFWILTYIFSGLAVLSKGIPGVAIPALVIAISTVVFKTYNETLKNSWGILAFLIIILPWHILMLKMYPNLFYEEYIWKHHILRFLGSDVIHRTEPWYFYILTLLWGLCPHIFVLFSQIPSIKKIKFDFKDDFSKLLTLNFIAIASILVFFSLSGAKLITYILPIYPFFAVLIGAIWLKFINEGAQGVSVAIIIINSIFTLATLALIPVKIFMPADLYTDFMPIQMSALVILVPFVSLNWVLIAKGARGGLFASLVLQMAILSAFVTPCAYKFDYSFGQDDLIKFAKIAKENNCTISTYLTDFKYSLLYYGNQSRIEYKKEKDLDWLRGELKKKNHIVIARNKKIKDLPIKIKVRGVKYSIIEE